MLREIYMPGAALPPRALLRPWRLFFRAWETRSSAGRLSWRETALRLASEPGRQAELAQFRKGQLSCWLQKRVRRVAVSARLAEPWGLSMLPPVPEIRPPATAHSMASSAQALTASASA